LRNTAMDAAGEEGYTAGGRQGVQSACAGARARARGQPGQSGRAGRSGQTVWSIEYRAWSLESSACGGPVLDVKPQAQSQEPQEFAVGSRRQADGARLSWNGLPTAAGPSPSRLHQLRGWMLAFPTAGRLGTVCRGRGPWPAWLAAETAALSRWSLPSAVCRLHTQSACGARVAPSSSRTHSTAQRITSPRIASHRGGLAGSCPCPCPCPWRRFAPGFSNANERARTSRRRARIPGARDGPRRMGPGRWPAALPSAPIVRCTGVLPISLVHGPPSSSLHTTFSNPESYNLYF
jgi:hypothetical protein